MSNSNIKDPSVLDYEERYGKYVEKDLIPQISRLSALKLTSEPLEFSVNSEKNEDEISQRLEEIFGRIDLNSIAFVMEELASREGNAVIVFEKNANNKYNLYVPTIAIKKIDPSTGKLYYLQIVRYLIGGDLINVVSELFTNETITRTYHCYDNEAQAKEDVENLKSGKGKLKENDKNSKTPKGLENIQWGEVKNDFGFIPAVYFENIPSIDKRGEPDININSRYVELLNKTFVRFHWELDFNKSKFIQQEEMGQNLYSSQYNNAQNRNAIANNYHIMRNNFGLPMGQAQIANAMFETSNQNLVNIIQIFNYMLKKLWEQSGQHQSGSDIGKQISDFQATQEKGAEHLRFKNKVLRRKFVWRELLWLMFLTMDDGIFGSLGEAPKEIKRSDIEFNLSFAKIDIEKDVIENEIKKIQANLTTREQAMIRIGSLAPGQNIEELAQKYLEINIKDIEQQQITKQGETLIAKPVQVQNPNTNNPGGSTNNQSKNFHNQKDKVKEGVK